MKKIYPFILSVLIISCNSDSDHSDNENSSAEERIEDTTNLEIEEEINESELNLSNDDLIAYDYYTQFINKIYNERSLELVPQVNSFPVIAEGGHDIWEDVEGGGRSTKFFKVLEEEKYVGIVGFNNNFEELATTCMVILEPGNFVTNAIITNVGDETVVKTLSNRSGIPDEGPFEMSYWQYDSNWGMTFPLYALEVDQDRELTTEEISEIEPHSYFNQWVPSYTYEGGECFNIPETAELPGSAHMTFKADGSIYLGQYQYNSALFYYQIPEPGKIKLYNVYYSELGYEEDETRQNAFEPMTVSYEFLETEEESISVLYLNDGIPGIFDEGAICREK